MKGKATRYNRAVAGGASQVGKTDFGSYATGGGNQLYFIQENIIDIDLIGVKFINPLK